jgi:hypothetical protein
MEHRMTERTTQPEKDTDHNHHKRFNVVVNARPRDVEGPELCFEEVVRLAYDPVPTGDLVTITVAFRRAAGQKESGTLSPGECVRLKEGMVFDVTVTDRS